MTVLCLGPASWYILWGRYVPWKGIVLASISAHCGAVLIESELCILYYVCVVWIILHV